MGRVEWAVPLILRCNLSALCKFTLLIGPDFGFPFHLVDTLYVPHVFDICIVSCYYCCLSVCLTNKKNELGNIISSILAVFRVTVLPETSAAQHREHQK